MARRMLVRAALISWVAFPAFPVFLLGCTHAPTSLAAAAQPVTAVDPKTAEAGYWYDQPATETIESSDYDELWQACRLAARDTGFTVDLRDYRQGVMTTQPLISKQVFEPWKQDVVTWHALAESTLSTVRRTIRFEIRRVGGEDGSVEAGAAGSAGASAPGGVSYRCVPKVLVERYSVSEHRITNVTEYREIFSLSRREVTHQRDVDRDPTSGVPVAYWYAVGRDRDLERVLAQRVRNRVGRAVPPPVVARAPGG